MLWTFWTAVFLGVYRTAYDEIYEGWSLELRFSLRVLLVLFGILFGAIGASATALIHAGIRRNFPMLRYPGYWLLLIQAGAFGSSMTYYTVVRVSEQFGRGVLTDVLGLLVSGFFAAVLYTLAARRLKELRWKCLLGTQAALTTLHCLAYAAISFVPFMLFDIYGRLYPLLQFGSAPLAVWVIVVAVADLVQGQRRDWLHWTGVITFVVAKVIALLQSLALATLQ